MFGRAFALFAAGSTGGLISWLLTEFSAPKTFGDPAWGRFELMLGVLAGAFIGLLIGAVGGYFQGSRHHMLRNGLIYGVLGAVAGPLGIQLGSAVFNAVVTSLGTAAVAGGLFLMVARASGWAIFGGLIGSVEGIVSRSVSRGVQGVIGGLLGGAAGGLVFELTGAITGPLAIALKGGNESGAISRALGLVCVGGGIGLLIGIVEALSRQAWLRLMLGRNEGKDFLVDAAQTVIGRDERADVPLFGDPNVGPRHALILRQGGQYVLADGGTSLGTGLNGQRVSQALLTSGDIINIGSQNLQFMLKSGRAQRIASPELAAVAAMPGTQVVAGAQPVGAPVGISAGQTVGYAPGGFTPVAPQAAAQPALVAMAGPLAGQRFSLDGPVEVGRDGTHIPLAFDQMASRRHAMLEPVAGGLRVTDLNSTNGVIVNGSKTPAAVLRSGDTLQIGISVFRIET